MNSQQINDHLTQLFEPTHISVVDESHKHAHHQGTPHTHNTHFHITIVSAHFDGQSLINRHRAINNALQTAFDDTLHALKITAKTPAEWPSQ